MRSQFRMSRGQWSEVRGQVEPSSSCLRALSMLIRCPSLVTPNSTQSSLVRAGRWEPSISCSWKRWRCSARPTLSSQSPTSYLFHRLRGRCLHGRRANRGPLRTGDGQGEACGEGEGERDLVRALALRITNRTSFGSEGRLRLDDFRMRQGCNVSVVAIGDFFPVASSKWEATEC